MIDSSEEGKVELLNQCIEIQRFLFNADSIAELLQLTEKLFEELLPLEYSGLYLFNERSQKLELKIARGFSEEERQKAEETAMDRHPGIVFNSMSQIYIPDTIADADQTTIDSPRSFNVRCRLYQPVVVKGKCIGVFGVVSIRPNAFDEVAKKIFEFACKVFGKAHLNLKQVDEIKAANEKLHLLSFLATHTDNAVIITDPAGKIEWVNDAFSKTTGYSIEEVQDKTPGSLLQGIDTENESRNILREAIQRKEKVETTIVNYAKDGQAYNAQIQIYPLFNDQNELIHYISLQKNVTESVKINAELQNQQKRFKAIVETLPDQLFIIQKDGTIIEFYSTLTDDLAIKPEQVVGNNIQQVLHEEVSKGALDRIQKVAKGEYVKAHQYSLKLGEETRFYEARYSSLDNDKVLAIVRNITEQKMSEIERDKQTIYYRLLSDFTSKFILADSLHLNQLLQAFLEEIGQYFEVDRSYIFEFNDEEKTMDNTFEWCAQNIEPQIDNLKGINFSDLQWWTDQILDNREIFIPNVDGLPKDLEALKELLQSQDIKSLFVLPMVVNRKIAGFYGFDSVVGTKHWTENETALLKLAGEIICNVFSRLQWEIDRDRFRIVFENAAFGAVIVNHADKIIYANRYTSNLMNCTLQQLQKLSFNNLFPTFLNGNNEVGYSEMIKVGSKESFEMMYPMPDGSVAVLLTNAVCITGPTNNETLVAYTFSDITGRKEQEKATAEALNIVSEQNKRLLNFSYIVSHNIRSHASNISGIASILAEDPEPEVRHQFVEGLVSSSKNLDSTLRHLNELLNIQSRVNIHNETVQLKEVVDRTIQAIALDVKANNVHFDLRISKDYTLNTDRAYLDSIVLNLISNAIKYRKPDQHPIITIQSGELHRQNWFSISDNGLGIDLNKYGDRIFGMFKTFHGNRDARGIGLFITRNQIEALGGKIEVNSTPGEGSTFTVYLPK